MTFSIGLGVSFAFNDFATKHIVLKVAFERQCLRKVGCVFFLELKSIQN
jgi:hypothetical protein